MLSFQEDGDVQLERRGDLLAPLKVLVLDIVSTLLPPVGNLAQAWHLAICSGQQLDEKTLGSSISRVRWHGRL